MQPAPGSTRLVRNLYGRLVGGARLQGLVTTLVVLVALRALGLAAGVLHDSSLSLVATLVVLAVLAALMLVGATGWATMDETGVHWRYYATHHCPWSEIAQASLAVHRVSIATVRETIELQVRGRRLVVTPAYLAGRDRVRFGRAVLAAAAAHGIPVQDGWTARR